MSWNIKTPGDYINGPLTVAGVTQFNSNVGIGAAPSGSWGTGWSSLSIKNAANNIAANGGAYFEFCQNSVFTSSGSLYVNSAPASRYEMGAGSHFWFRSTDATPTAGNPVTWDNAMTLDASGNLILGAASSGSGFTVQRGASISAEIKLNQTGASGRDWRIASTGSGYGSAGSLIFYDATAAAERARFNTSGAFVLGGGAIAANGIGIAFPSAQSASTDANTLDDYEEGTWTPTYVGTTGGTPTVATTFARYTKVGRLVTVSFQVTITNVSTATGYFAFSLPFASDSSGQCGAFRETAVLGQMGMVTLLTASQIILSRYDNGNVLANNYTFVGTFSYLV